MIDMVFAPNKYKFDKFSVFLAGSIEMGKAENWQERVANWMKKNILGIDILILNPRRKDWDSSWVQEIENKNFREQVEWELDGQDNCDAIIMYFDPKTKSPITLLELGLYKNKKIFVCCPKGYWRRGNVEIVCKRYNIKFYEEFNKLLEGLKEYIEKKFKKELSLNKSFINNFLGDLDLDKNDLMSWNRNIAQECSIDNIINNKISGDKNEE